MKRLWWATAWGLSLLGCSSDNAPPNHEQGRVALCHGLCDLGQRCKVADSGCATRCVAEYDPRGVRGSVLAAAGDCVARSDCSALDSEEGLDSCFDLAAEQEPLHDALIAYCESAAQSYFRCNVFWSVEECTRTQSVWEDAVLEAARACHASACDDLQGCEQAIFESPP